MSLEIFKKYKKKKLDYLELTPFHRYTYEDKPDGLIDVLVPRFNNNILEKIFIPKNKSRYIKANLDEFGTVTWRLINGKTKVSEISNELLNIFGDKVEPVNDRLTRFLTNLYNNGFISFNELRKDK